MFARDVHVRCLQVENLIPPNASSQVGPVHSSACVRCQPECVSTVEPDLDFGSPGLPLTTVPESDVLDSGLVESHGWTTYETVYF